MPKRFIAHLKKDLALLAALASPASLISGRLVEHSTELHIHRFVIRVMLAICAGGICTAIIIPAFDPEIWPRLIFAAAAVIVPFFCTGLYISVHVPFSKIGWAFVPYWTGTLLSLAIVLSTGDEHASIVHYSLAATLLLPNMTLYEVLRGRFIYGPPLFFLGLIMLWVVQARHFPNAWAILALFFSFFFIGIFTTHVFRSVLAALLSEIDDKSRRVNELSNVNKLLDNALGLRRFGILFYNSEGELFFNRGIALDEISEAVKPEHFRRLEDLKAFIEEVGDIEFDQVFSQDTKITLGSVACLLSAHRLGGMSVLTYVDVTRQEGLEMQLRAREKLSAIGQITSGVAHNYNNMLAVALSNLEAIPRDGDEAQWEDYVAPAIEAIEQSANISHKLLKLAGQRLDAEAINPAELVEEMKELLNSALGAGINLTLEVRNDALVHVDRSELESAIINLAINARNAMNRSGNITISVDKLGAQLVISVVDDGPGIPKPVLERIFEPFFTTQNAPFSSGLGLSTVKSFVEQSGGEVKVQTAPRGTRVSLCFPIYDGPKSATRLRRRVRGKAKPPINRDALGEKPLAGSEVLLVDDNAKFLMSLTRTIHSAGGIAHAIGDQAAALRFVKKNGGAITLAFIDLTMPGIDGIRLAAHFRRIAPTLRLVMMTGEASREQIASALAMGFEEVLMKPVRLSDVIRLCHAKKGVLALS